MLCVRSVLKKVMSNDPGILIQEQNETLRSIETRAPWKPEGDRRQNQQDFHRDFFRLHWESSSEFFSRFSRSQIRSVRLDSS